MRSAAGRALLGVALLIVAIALFVVLQDDGGSDVPASGASDRAARTEAKPGGGEAKRPAPPVISVKDGKPVGGVEELEFSAGDRIRFEVASDVADEVHVHGYDLSAEVEAGGSARFDFEATIEGVFEVELEERAEPIAELRVNP